MNQIAGSTAEQGSERFGLDDVEWAFLLDRLGRPPSETEGELFAILQGEEIAHRSSRSLLDSFIAEELHLPNPPGVRIGAVKLNDRITLTSTVVDANRGLTIRTELACQSAISEALLRLTALGSRAIGIIPILRVGPLEDVTNQLILQAVHAGAAASANIAGIPVLDFDLFFHARYHNSPLLNICAIGAAEHDESGHTDAIEPGPKTVLYLGQPTGREHLVEVDKKGRPIEGKGGKTDIVMRRPSSFSLRSLLDCIGKMEDEHLLTAVAPAGIGGIGVAFCNLALQLGAGIKADLDRLPLKFPEINVHDLLFSETPERALIAFSATHHKRVLGLLRQHQIPSVILGETDDLDSLRFEWNRRVVADLPLLVLGKQRGRKNYQLVKFPPMLKQKKEVVAVQPKVRRQRSSEQNEWGAIREAAATPKAKTVQSLTIPKNIEDSWVDLLADPNILSREGLKGGLFSDTGGSNLLPYRAPGSILRLRRLGGYSTAGDCVAAASASSSLYMQIDAYLGAVHSVADAVRGLAAIGAEPLGVAYSLNFGDPEDYREICDLSEAVRGIGDACKFWKIPISTETVSLFNGSESIPILPTPGIYMLGSVPSLYNAPGIPFRNRKDKIFIIGNTKLEIECSEYAHYLHRYNGGKLPDIDFDYESVVNGLIRELVNSRLLCSAAPMGRGGLAIALAQCCMLRRPPIGASVTILNTLGDGVNRPDALLFSETAGRFIVSCSAENEDKVLEACTRHKVPVSGMGDVGGKIIELQEGIECQIPLSTAYRVWSTGLNYYLGLENEEDAAAG